MKKKTLDVSLNVKSLSEDGSFSGYASVFDVVDSYSDVVKKGAFVASIERLKEKNRKLPILWMHDSTKPIGTFTKLIEDEHGLYVEGKLLIDDVIQAKEAYALLKAEAISGMSIGYYLKKWETDAEEGVWNLTELDLFETSLVTFPANDYARVLDVKSKLEGGEIPSLKEFEKFLREAGFSKTQATAIANHGLSKLHKEQSESVSVLDGVLSILNKKESSL